jgi:hypothetical protein
MKIKHNKKRNTAFVYEALVRETTVAVLKRDTRRQTTALNLIERHFAPNTPLKKDLECYQSLMNDRGLGSNISQRILKETHDQRQLLSSDDLFKSQSKLIKDINTELSPNVFTNFVPNYKHLATIAQMFSSKNSPRSQVMLENKVLEYMTDTTPGPSKGPPVDKVLYHTFVEKFNTKYAQELLPEQKELLTYYISSFSDNAVELKMFLNEELHRLKSTLHKAATTQEMSSDSEMTQKAQQIIEKLDAYANDAVNEGLLLTVLKTQKLVKEISKDVHNS